LAAPSIDSDEITDKLTAALTKSVSPLVRALQDGIQELKSGSHATITPQQTIESVITSDLDLKKIAEHQQQTVTKMSEEIESQKGKKSQKVNLEDLKDIRDIASELE